MLKRCFYHALGLPSLQNHDPNKLLFSRSYPLVLNYFSTAKMQEKMHQCSFPPCGFSWWDRTRQGWIQLGVIDERGQVAPKSTTAAMGKDNEGPSEPHKLRICLRNI